MKKLALVPIALLALAACGTDKPTPIATTPAATATATASAKGTPPPAVGTFGDGIYLVPQDLPYGTYRGNVPSDTAICYWTPYDADGNALGGNQQVHPGDRVTVIVREKERDATVRTMKISGCGLVVKDK